MRHLRLVRPIDIEEAVKCECSECGKTWLRGEQDDNETICLRCEYLTVSDDEYDHEDS